MNTNIKVTLSKEDRFSVQGLVNEINSDPKSAYNLCELYGCEGFSLDEFSDFDRLTEEEKDRLIEDFAISKSEADAELTNSQIEKFEIFADFFERED